VLVGFALSVLLFGAAHLCGGWWLFFNALILGAGFTLVYRKTRSVVPVTLLHLFSNLAYACLNYGG
jgi:membrane protease YdiL (CAAX protease family)